MKLHRHFRCSAAYRVHIALNLKAIAYRNLPVNPVRGEQREAAYAALDPACRARGNVRASADTRNALADFPGATPGRQSDAMR